MRMLGINGSILNWTREFLTNRTQSVIVNGRISAPKPVISGVPQGSVLGPLLFLIMIGDIDKNLNHTFLKSFADDTRASKGVKDVKDVTHLQEDLNEIYSWSEENNMEFNSTKFEAMRYGRDEALKSTTSYLSAEGAVIKDMEHLRDLGVNMSDDCSFKKHITNIVEAAKKKCSWVLRTFKTSQRIPMMTLYKY